MKLARRLSVIEPSPTLAVSAKAAKLKSEGIDVVSFGAGEPDFDTPVHIKEAAKKALDAGATKYTLVEGTVPLRKAVAKWIGDAHGFKIDPSEVIVSSGAKQSIFNAVLALIDEGDEVIIPTPAWVSYNDIVKLAGGRPVNVPTKATENFQVRVEDVAKAITPRTKMILVCSPSNPTGAIYDEETLRGLAKLAVEKNVWLMTDDIYRTLVYGDGKFFQPATIGPEVRAHTIIIDGVSKAFAMTGWRVGFTVAPKHVVEAMATLQGQSTTHAASVAQAAALAAHRGPDRRAREDARRVRQAPQGDGRAAARDPGRDVRRAEGRVLRLPEPVGVHRQEDARGEEDRERRAALRVADRGRAGRRRHGLGVRRAGLRAAVVRDLDEERRGGCAAVGGGVAETDVARGGARSPGLVCSPAGRIARLGIGKRPPLCCRLSKMLACGKLG